MKAQQAVIDQPAGAQLDELDSVDNHVNENYVNGSSNSKTKYQNAGAPTGKFSSEDSADKRKGVDAIKADEKIPVPHQPVADLGELYAHNAMLKPEYDNQVQAIASATGGNTKFRSGDGMKSPGRTLGKITADYGADASRTIDPTAASIYYDSVDDLLQGYKAVEANPFFNVVRVKKTLAKASSYGDINIAVEMGSADVEIDVNGVKKKNISPAWSLNCNCT